MVQKYQPLNPPVLSEVYDKVHGDQTFACIFESRILVKVEKLAKNGEMVQNCYPLSPGGRGTPKINCKNL